MLVHKNDIQIILAEFIDKHLVPSASGWYKMGLGAASFVVSAKTNSMLEQPQTVQMLKALGIMNEQDNIDMDYLREMAFHSLDKNSGKTPPIAGYLVLDKTDIENLYSIAQRLQNGGSINA